ncbi:MAG TPA: DUF4403 family protein [Chitinophagaceae bacterium]|nr:DUF4403 family protein [Chitinophagaceae bacterium]
MKGRGIIFLILVLFVSASCSHKINPSKPSLPVSDFKLDSLPDSEINIPVQINLQPLYSMAEKNIDTIFTSPGYPDKWVYEGCSTRYKYSFRRGPLQMKASGNTLNLGFTGYYKIIGSTRACINGTAISPWTPPCKCGFDEGERKVNVSFVNSFIVQPDYKVRLFVNRMEPQPLNKCEVCFWGQDITTQVMKELKNDLDDAKKNIEQSYGLVDLRSRFQQIWDQLNKSYDIYGLGWLQIHPQQVRINSLYASNDLLNVYLGLSAKPVISFEKPAEQNSPIPNITNSATAPGFNIFLDAILQYDSLGNILNQQIEGRQFDLGKGPVKKKFVINSCQIFGAGNEKLIIRVDFGGSAEGTAYFTGKPSYDPISHIVEVKDLDFDVKTKDKFLKTASWLFNKKITDEISSYTKFDLTSFIDSTQMELNQQLNREWMPGIHSYGNISAINLLGIYPLSKFLVLRSNCSGLLSMQINTATINY